MQAVKVFLNLMIGLKYLMRMMRNTKKMIVSMTITILMMRFAMTATQMLILLNNRNSQTDFGEIRDESNRSFR